MAEESISIKIPVAFLGAEDFPILYANQFVLSYQQDEFILTVGQVAPPLLIGSPEEQREQATQLSYIPVKVVARLALNRSRVRDLIEILQQQLEQYDQDPRMREH